MSEFVKALMLGVPLLVGVFAAFYFVDIEFKKGRR